MYCQSLSWCRDNHALYCQIMLYNSMYLHCQYCPHVQGMTILVTASGNTWAANKPPISYTHRFHLIWADKFWFVQFCYNIVQGGCLLPPPPDWLILVCLTPVCHLTFIVHTHPHHSFLVQAHAVCADLTLHRPVLMLCPLQPEQCTRKVSVPTIRMSVISYVAVLIHMSTQPQLITYYRHLPPLVSSFFQMHQFPGMKAGARILLFACLTCWQYLPVLSYHSFRQYIQWQ